MIISANLRITSGLPVTHSLPDNTAKAPLRREGARRSKISRDRIQFHLRFGGGVDWGRLDPDRFQKLETSRSRKARQFPARLACDWQSSAGAGTSAAAAHGLRHQARKSRRRLGHGQR